MKPYYDHKGITIYHGDCLEILPDLEPVDLVLTDPPYGVDFKYESYSDTKNEHESKISAWFDILRRAGNILAVSCGIVNIWNWPKANWVLCWHKPFSVGHSPFGANNWEPLLVYTENGRRCERQSDYFKATFIKEHFDHPCPKPKHWAMGAIQILSKPNEIIIDPFMGSGTTLVAAKELGRKAIGIEIEEKYCEIAVRRLAQEVLPFGSNQTFQGTERRP